MRPRCLVRLWVRVRVRVRVRVSTDGVGCGLGATHTGVYCLSDLCKATLAQVRQVVDPSVSSRPVWDPAC